MKQSFPKCNPTWNLLVSPMKTAGKSSGFSEDFPVSVYTQLFGTPRPTIFASTGMASCSSLDRGRALEYSVSSPLHLSSAPTSFCSPFNTPLHGSGC